MLGAITGAISDVVSGVTEGLGLKKSSSSKEESKGDSDFAGVFKRLITPDAGNNVNEEELFAGLARDRIAALKGEDAAKAYDTALTQAKSSLRKPNGFVSMEEAGISALKSLRTSGVLTSEEADSVYSAAFDAAQLDSNKDALFDSRGGAGDVTIAVAEMESALMNAKLLLDKISSGEIAASSRALDAASPNASSGAGAALSINLLLTTDGDPSAVGDSNTPNGTVFDGANGFLFKPISEANGKLAILMPEALAHQVESVLLKDINGKEIEKGNSTGYGDLGTREKFAFSRSGGSYPAGVVVEAKLADGTVKSWTIPDPSKRYD